jgi:hypothetical protein
VPSLADLWRAWLLKQLGVNSATATEADLEAAMLAAQSGWAGVATNRAYAVGRYYGPSTDVSVGTVATVLNRMWLVPFDVGRQITLDRIGIEITVAGTTANVVRLGIYGTAAGLPSNRILEAGSVDGTAVAFPELAISQTLTPGLYWLAVVSQVGTPCEVRALGGASIPYIGHTANPGSTNYRSYRVDSITGALPASIASPVADGSAPRPLVRIAA